MPIYKDFRYTEKEDHIIIRAYCGDSEDVVVPAEIMGKPVQEISSFAFVPEDDVIYTTTKDRHKRCTKRIRSIQLPDTILRLERTFDSCYELEEIMIPAHAELIGENFHACYELKQITVDPENPYYRSKNGILYDKEGEKLLRCPPGYVFGQTDMLDGVNTIGEAAFEMCKNLLEITIPENVRVIEGSAFSNCGELSRIHLHPNIQMADGCHFWYCKALDNVVYYNTDDVIPANEFTGCGNLKNIDIRCKTTYIGEDAFSGSAIREFVVFKGTKAIKRGAFMHCFDLKTITIPRSVSRICESAFINCGKTYLTEEQKADPEFLWRGPHSYATFRVVAGSKADVFCQQEKYDVSYM